MEHLFTHFKELGPWAVTAALTLLIRMVRKGNKSLSETRFKADECHEELSKREPEYARRLATWKAHRRTF
jgi:hypothetical protein